MDIDLVDVTIDSMEHWYEVRHALLMFSHDYPFYHRDFNKLLATIDAIMRESSDILVRIRRNPSIAGRTAYEQKMQQANNVLHLAQQNLLLLILSKRDFA